MRQDNDEKARKEGSCEQGGGKATSRVHVWRHRILLRAFRAQLNEGIGAGSFVSKRHRSQLAAL